MLTIALDEQGDFENLQGKVDSEPVFIGGIVYDDLEITEDYENEKKRLQAYLKNVCSSVNCRYPQDLHYSSTGNNVRNVAKVKTRFSNTIKEFLEQGTWNKAPLISDARKGKYHIFALLRGKNGKRKLLSPDVSEAVKDDFASNLYVHMAEDVVERLIFHNPVLENVTKIRLELATRRVILSGDEEKDKIEQYAKIGFRAVERKERENPDVVEYLLTNPYNYRTAIEREMLDCGQHKILIDHIGVKSIYYKHQCSGMDFLYLADAICSFLSYKVGGNESSYWIEQFYNRSHDINNNANNMIWAYDEVDDFFSKAWKCYEEGDYYRALSIAFDGSKCDSGMTSFYKENWFKYISEYISTKDDVVGFSLAVKKYRDSLLNNNLNQEKLVYIFKTLEKMSRNINFKSNKEEAELFDLYDSGLSAYIHNSNLENVEYCFEKTKQYAEYISTEKYLRTRNKMVVFLCDKMLFEKALVIADENVKYHELLSDMKRKIFGCRCVEFLNHAIAISQRAQVLAFLNDERAEQDFVAALEIMDDGTPDKYITQSYLLHYYISKGEKEKYEQVAVEYFGNEKLLTEQLYYISGEGSKEKDARFSLKYALYVYIKALYVFYLDELPDTLIDKLSDIENTLTKVCKNAQKQINGHPWEIIYKYLGLIMQRYNRADKAVYYKNMIKKMFGEADGLIKTIACESQNSIEAKKEISEYTYMYL